MTDRMPPAGLPLALLAGDRDQSMQWLENLLTTGGYAVLRERTGRHALVRARSTQPDVIIVDADLPDIAGVEVCRTLRNDPRITGSTPILLSAPGPAGHPQRLTALRVGAWECIAPPHEADEILLQIDAFVRAKLDADRARAEGLLDPLTGLYNRQGLARRARELGSQAFRQHGALACVALALDVGPGDATAGADDAASAAVTRCVHALKATARLSDVVGRLSPTEYAVLAPGTDASGARRLAERLARAMQTSAAAEPGSRGLLPLRVRCGYEAVANVGYAPIEPLELLVRASAALRTGKPEAEGWIRRFDAGISPSP